MEYLLNYSLTGKNPRFSCPNCSIKTAHTVVSNKINTQYYDDEYHYTYVHAAECLTCEGTSYIFEHSVTTTSFGQLNESLITWSKNKDSIVRDPTGQPLSIEFIESQYVIEPKGFSDVPTPNSDLSAETIKLYNEAAAVLAVSPRAATALLRVTFETLLKKDLNLPGKTINDMINNLYSTDIPDEMLIALHFVRIVGNAADHIKPGLIQLESKDGVETAKTLFSIINYIADEKITQKNKLTGLTQFFSPNQKKRIEDDIAKNK